MTRAKKRAGQLVRVPKDAVLDLLIDDALAQSERLPKLTVRILDAQKKLREHASDDAWAAYLALEEAVNARVEEQMQLLGKRLLRLYERNVF